MMNPHNQITGLILSAIFVRCLTGWVGQASGALQPDTLRCEYLSDPMGIGQTAPRLSWMLTSPTRGDHQLAYRVLVASSPELLSQNQGDLWDSGKVTSEESAHVVYEGKPLTSQLACYWKVQIWSALAPNDPTWSPVARWTMGLLSPQDWKAKWIDSSTAMREEAESRPVKIIHAVYEAIPTRTRNNKASATSQPVESVDVTEILNSKLKNGTIDLTVNNDSMGSDPALNKRKRLVIEYEVAGKHARSTIEEESNLTLPPLSGRLWYLRKSFQTKGAIRSATLYATALGVYEFHLNGKRVGDQVLAPGWTDYNKRIRYQAYDVTPLVKTGGNAVAAEVAPGWYAGHLGNGGNHEYGTIPALLAQLQVTYADGSTETIASDESWKTSPSPVISTDFMLGESYDARAVLADWDQPSLNDSSWKSASPREQAQIAIQSQVAQPVRETGTIKPIKLTNPAPGRWTFDLGQNMVGVVRLKVSAPAGTVITLHHAEMLKPDGTVYTTNLRGAPSVDTYTCKGGGSIETWQPQFTFHGFRYVELTGLVGEPTLDTVTGIVLGSDTPRTGSFSCSDPRINQLMSNIQWGQRGNYLSVPTDCPQRDERLGWMGDAQVFVRTATCDADVAAFFTKWLVDVDDAQTPDGAYTDVSPFRGSGFGTPAWGDAGVICPWTIYLAYGDKRLLEQHLPNMTRWIEWCKANSTDLLRSDPRTRGGDFGDWLSIKADTPKDVIGTAYFAYSTHLVAMSYAAIGDKAHADQYNQLFQDIKAAFNKAYVAPDGRIKGNTQCCYAMALKFELLPDELRAKAAEYLVDDIKAKDMHLSTGFVGVSYLLPMLTQTGNLDVAYKLLLQDSFPSWLFSVKHGATTIWERWDGWTPEKGFQNPGMNSFNHYSLGSCGEWLYDSVAGIRWDIEQPGYKHIILRPLPPPETQIIWAKGTLGSVYGKITSDWKIEDGTLSLNISLPPNTTATLYIPTRPGDKVLESGKQKSEGVQFLRNEDHASVYEVQSGSYSFTVKH
jgi:alpha-L-rhamnosidase